MTRNSFDPILAADPSNPNLVAADGSITLYTIGDATQAPVPLFTLDDQPMDNPVTVNSLGFGPAFQVDDLDAVAWAGGGLGGVFRSPDAALLAAQASATSSAASATSSAASATSASASATSAAGAATAAATSATAAGTSATSATASAASAAALAAQVVPAGGTTGQVLSKTSATNYATGWIDPPAGTGGASAFADLTGQLGGDQAAPWTVMAVIKTGSTWPVRPSSRADVVVIWMGADPDPTEVDSGNGGMLRGVDMRSKPQT